ncbi:MAG: polysaccharide deacetylase family protein [Rhodothermales bacterium]
MNDLVTLIGTRLPRTVASWFPDVTFRVPTEERVAYLTFDDGPNDGLTQHLLSILERHDARASFFLVGSNVQRHPALVRRLVEEGHAVGNHTFSHVDAWRTPAAEVIRELDQATGVLEDVLGTAVPRLRPPYGRFTPAMRDWCRRRGQIMTMWDLGTGDYLERVSRSHVVRHVESFIRPGTVIVLHDNTCCADTTPEAVDAMLAAMTAEGWRFEPLPDG